MTENIKKTDNYNSSNNPIVDITFSLGQSLEFCSNKLKENDYKVIEGDIRESCGGKYGLLGIKKYKDCPKCPITNIIGTVSKIVQPEIINENGCDYYVVKDQENKNGNIHYNESGVLCYLYYTRSEKYKPIKDLVFCSHDEPRGDKDEVAQNSEKSLRKGDLDLATMRGFQYNKRNWNAAKYNYIYIIR